MIAENRLGRAVGCTLKAPYKESRKKTDAQTGRREAGTPAASRKKAPQQAVEASCQPLVSANKEHCGCG